MHIIRDLEVKAMPTTMKRDNVIRHMRLRYSLGEVEYRIGKKARVRKPMYLKKA